jgi:hypothetical protein
MNRFQNKDHNFEFIMMPSIKKFEGDTSSKRSVDLTEPIVKIIEESPEGHKELVVVGNARLYIPMPPLPDCPDPLHQLYLEIFIMTLDPEPPRGQEGSEYALPPPRRVLLFGRDDVASLSPEARPVAEQYIASLDAEVAEPGPEDEQWRTQAGYKDPPSDN